MRKIPTPGELIESNKDRTTRETKRCAAIEKAEYERQLNELHEKVAEWLIPRYKGSALSLEVTAYHDDVIKQVNTDYSEVGWKVKRVREGAAVLLRFSKHGGEE